jgi:undecaprenyl-diphosphatase
MTHLEVLLLGVIQGIAEFLPISSSAHLILAKSYFKIPLTDHFFLFTLILHLGSLFSILVVFRKKIAAANKQFWIQVAIATLPLFPASFAFKKIKALYNRPEYLGYCLLFTAAALFLGSKYQAAKKAHWMDALYIGAAQTLALIPGISRSGLTISCAQGRGWKIEEAIFFSFMLALAAILGSIGLETLSFLTNPHSLHGTIQVNEYLLGFFTSFILGVFSLKFLLHIAKKGYFPLFFYYCLTLGLYLVLFN